MSADRGHLHHRLVDAGFSQKETVTILSSYTALLSITAIILTSKGLNRALVLVAVMIMLSVCIKLYRENKSIGKEYLSKLDEKKGEDNEEN